MEYTQEVRVLYSDTDAYGVVWHGAYTKWFESGRVGFSEAIGMDIATLESKNIVFPVVEMNVRYKSSAKLNEKILIKTVVKKLSPVSVIFEHKVYEKESQTLRVVAETTIVVVDTKENKLLRRMPEDIYDLFEKSMAQ